MASKTDLIKCDEKNKEIEINNQTSDDSSIEELTKSPIDDELDQLSINKVSNQLSTNKKLNQLSNISECTSFNQMKSKAIDQNELEFKMN